MSISVKVRCAQYKMTRRNYRSNLDFVADAFRACLANSTQLVKASKILLDSGHHALCLSLSVLAIEELGKLFCVDGLLFARADDERAKTFAKSLKSHSTKLSAFELFPLLLKNVAATDPRFGSENRFDQAILIGTQDLLERGNLVLELLAGEGFTELDAWKQLGFYAQPSGSTFRTPEKAIETKMAESVYMLAWRASTTLEFLLKEENLERYINAARSLRATMTDADHLRLLEASGEMIEQLFPSCVESREIEKRIFH